MAELPGTTVKQTAKHTNNHFMVSPPLASSAFLFGETVRRVAASGGYEVEGAEDAPMKPLEEYAISFRGVHLRALAW